MMLALGGRLLARRRRGRSAIALPFDLETRASSTRPSGGAGRPGTRSRWSAGARRGAARHEARVPRRRHARRAQPRPRARACWRARLRGAGRRRSSTRSSTTATAAPPIATTSRCPSSRPRSGAERGRALTRRGTAARATATRSRSTATTSTTRARGLRGARRRARVHVAGALPGERCRPTVDARLAPPARRLGAPRRASTPPRPTRRPPACARLRRRAAAACCSTSTYDGQLRWKTGARRRALAGATPRSPACRSRDCVAVAARRSATATDRSWSCARARAGGAGAGRLRAALARRRRSRGLPHRRAAARRASRRALRDLLARPASRPTTSARFTGDLRHVVLRANHARRGARASRRRARATRRGVAALARALRAARPEVVGVVENVNPSRGNAIYGDRGARRSTARPTLEERVGDVRLRLSPRAFFQANRDVAALAYAAIAARSPRRPGEHVVDAYCGVGGIALDARAAPRARGRSASRSTPPPSPTPPRRRRAERRRATRASSRATSPPRLRDVAARRRRRAQPAAQGLRARGARRGRAPRARASIAYLCCDPDTLARDLARSPSAATASAPSRPFDMLPHTPHVEALAILDRELSARSAPKGRQARGPLRATGGTPSGRRPARRQSVDVTPCLSPPPQAAGEAIGRASRRSRCA